jgi:hypothetical protein
MRRSIIVGTVVLAQETISVNSTATFPVRNGRTNATFEITPHPWIARLGRRS